MIKTRCLQNVVIIYQTILSFVLSRSCKCNGKRCKVSKTDMFTCSNDKTTYKTIYKFGYNEKCLVYIITCNKCLKKYVG